MSSLREPNAEPIPGYRLIEPLGSGGFGEVWKCEAPGGLFKAIKFVYGNLNSFDGDGARAEQEHHALQRIKEVRHPFVLSLDRIEVVDGELVIVMELADKSLHDALTECNASGLVGIPRDTLLRYIRDAAEALDHMNERHNLQHLDIKPRNLFLISERVKVADFGLVKHLERQNSGIMAGVTPLYAPPETFSGKITGHSDQYSLAIVYQELLTGQRPFTGKNPRQLAQQHMTAEPELRPLPEPERPVVARALAKDPMQRFPSCMAFVRALHAAQGRLRAATSVEESPVDVAPRLGSPAETLEDIELASAVRAGSVSDRYSHGGDHAHEQASSLGMTVVGRESGALRPTIVIGIGSFGRRALREVRCRFLDRFGDLQKVPLVRFLYVDPDPDAVQDAVRGAPEVALSPSEVYHLPLQGVSYYRRRSLDQLSEWLPREKLYSIPRSPQTQGSRALGRLAFVDNHHRFLARVRRELQKAIHPDTLYQSVTQTGLALRENVPQIHVIAAAGGGGSGFLVDLGYALRRLLHQLHFPEAEATLFLFCGAPADPATSHPEQANVYATLTELNHFADPSIPFAAQYGADGPRIIDPGPAFTCAYLMQLPHRGPDALRDAIAHLGSYLFHELTTPLGCHLARERHLPPLVGVTHFRSFGTYAVWFPRGLLLRLAALQLCTQLIEEWQAIGEPTAVGDVEAAALQVVADPELSAEALTQWIATHAHDDLNGAPEEALARLLAGLEEESQNAVALQDPGSWARRAVARVLEFAGPGTESSGSHVTFGEWRMSHLHRALVGSADELAREWDERLTQSACKLMEHPGRRVAAAEAALNRFVQFCEEQSDALGSPQLRQTSRREQAWQQLEAALNGCLAELYSGGWGLSGLLSTGGRARRLLRVFTDHLAVFAHECLAEQILSASRRLLNVLTGRMKERLQDLVFCRQRLGHLRESLESLLDESSASAAVSAGMATTAEQSPNPRLDFTWHVLRETATVHLVLPDGAAELEEAATRFASTIGPEQLAELDQALQDHVLAERGGLQGACSQSSDLLRDVVMPLLDQAATYLSDHLPVTDVAQVELSSAENAAGDIASRIHDGFARAAPLVPGQDAGQQRSFLLVPASSAGKSLGEAARESLEALQLVNVPGQAHLLFCCEQGYLSAEELQQLFEPCRAAYENAVPVPQISPHARFDIIDWLPLDP